MDGSTYTTTPAKSIADHFYFYLERLWIILICLIGGIVLGLHQSHTSPTAYKANAVIQAESQLAPVADVEISESASLASKADLIAALKTKLMLESLYHSVTANPELATLLPDHDTVSKQEYDAARHTLARQLRLNTSVLQQRGTSILEITTTLPDADIAKAVVSGILEELGRNNSAAQAGASNANIALLNEQIQELRDRMSESEQSLATYNHALQIQDDIRASESRLLGLRKEYLEKWPPLVQEKKHLALLHEAFDNELDRIIRSVSSELAYWQSLTNTTDTLSGEELTNFRLSTMEARHNMISRDFHSDSALYDSLVAKAKMGDVQLDFLKDEFSIIQPAATDYQPIKLSRFDALLRFGLGGLVLGILMANLLGSFDKSLHRIDDVESLTGLPVCTVVPYTNGKGNSKGNSKEGQRLKALQAETYRTLQANLAISHPDARTILITSSVPGEGKSTVSTNLTEAFAEANPSEKVLLIDMDLKRPKVSSYLGLDKGHPGVYEYFQGSHTLKEVIQQTAAGFFVITAGNIPPQSVFPEEKLIVGLLAEVGRYFHRTVIDSPPILAVSDAMVTAHHTDVVCLVYKMWKTPKAALKRTMKQFSNHGIRVAGTVANAMPVKTMLGQGDYYYSYYNSGYSAYTEDGFEDPEDSEKSKSEPIPSPNKVVAQLKAGKHPDAPSASFSTSR